LEALRESDSGGYLRLDARVRACRPHHQNSPQPEQSLCFAIDYFAGFDANFASATATRWNGRAVIEKDHSFLQKDYGMDQARRKQLGSPSIEDMI
jgi:hypothetical protein